MNDSRDTTSESAAAKPDAQFAALQTDQALSEAVAAAKTDFSRMTVTDLNGVAEMLNHMADAALGFANRPSFAGTPAFEYALTWHDTFQKIWAALADEMASRTPANAEEAEDIALTIIGREAACGDFAAILKAASAMVETKAEFERSSDATDRRTT